jgi:predicted  nucleic acid-binding Zn-ribbon protein
MCDRTQEFIKCVGGCAITTVKKRFDEAPKTRTAFYNDASEIAKGIHRTSGDLNKLTKLVRQQGLFDDSSDEINNLIFRVKQDLDELRSKCDSADSFVNAGSKDKNQSASHNGNVVCQLNADIRKTQKDFKTVLDTRASKMKLSQNRKVALTGPPTNFGRQHTSNIAQSDQKHQPKFHSATNGLKDGMQPMPMGAITPYNGHSMPADYSDFDDQHGQSNQKLLFAPLKVNQYYESRETAINEVEKTIHEFGQLFVRLTSMISEQQEMVERIDDDVESAMENTQKGMDTCKVGNRLQTSLYTKIGFLLAAFLMFFLLFLM